jgi:hypothetical protein
MAETRQKFTPKHHLPEPLLCRPESATELPWQKALLALTLLSKEATLNPITDPKLDDDPLQSAVGGRAYPQKPLSGTAEGASSPGATEPGDQGAPGHSAFDDTDRSRSEPSETKEGYRGA